jgi:hypothetical protein
MAKTKAEKKTKIVLGDDQQKAKKQTTKTGYAGLVGKDYDTLTDAQKSKLNKAALEKLGITENGIANLRRMLFRRLQEVSLQCGIL